jgi:hypothetical protein
VPRGHAKLWGFKLVTELEAGETTEVEVACLEYDEQAGLADLGFGRPTRADGCNGMNVLVGVHADNDVGWFGVADYEHLCREPDDPTGGQDCKTVPGWVA